MPLVINKFKTPVGQDEIRHRTVIETEPCAIGTLHSRILRQELLRYMADDPFFTQCGGVDFQKQRLWHDGMKWIAEFEATVAKQS